MPLAKCTMLFTSNLKSWTEAYWTNTSTDPYTGDPNNLQAVLDYFNTNLVTKRTPLLGKQYSCTLLRSTFPLENVIGEIRYVNIAGNQSHEGAAAELSVVTKCGNLNNTAKKYISLRGIWDEVEIEGGKFVGDGIAAWQGHWNSFATMLITKGWGWYGRMARQRANITTIVQNANFTQTITINNAMWAAVIGTPQVIRLSGVNVKSRLNQSLVVNVTGASTATTVLPYATFPYASGGRVSWNTNGFIDIANVAAQRLGSRDVGNSYHLTVGRRKATPRG